MSESEESKTVQTETPQTETAPETQPHTIYVPPAPESEAVPNPCPACPTCPPPVTCPPNECAPCPICPICPKCPTPTPWYNTPGFMVFIIIVAVVLACCFISVLVAWYSGSSTVEGMNSTGGATTFD